MVRAFSSQFCGYLDLIRVTPMDTQIIAAASKHQARSDILGMQGATRRDCNGTLASLLAKATVALETDRSAAKSCIRRAAALLGIDLGLEGDAAERSCPRGGLAPWQAKLIRSHIEDRLGSNIRAADLACIVQFSTSHFFRAFRESFGDTPLAYIMKRRILHAQEMMLRSRQPLAQIALECGMCDQAHFTRVFHRVVGTNPQAWRRRFGRVLRPSAPAADELAVTAPSAAIQIGWPEK
jgi:AraC family transcriptional regulator